MGGDPTPHIDNDLRMAIMELRERVARLEQRVEDIDKKLDNIMEHYLSQRPSLNGVFKWVVITLGLVFSFIAAVLGVRWNPP